MDIHGFHQGTPFYFNRLGENQVCNDTVELSYHNIIFLSNICWTEIIGP